MNFGKIIDTVPVVVATIAVLSIPFFVYNFLQTDEQCKQTSGVMIKSSGGWICIKTETK
jgi:hypothetical protein